MPKTINIVVVEDNLALQELMVDHLIKDGYAVHGVGDADELADRMASEQIDILVLDINLPGENGLSIASRLREVNPGLYIVMMTARTSEKDKMQGYESGADIYLTKPASPAEVSAAISSIYRRIKVYQNDRLTLSLNLQKKQIVGRKGTVNLGSMEVILLKSLAEAPNQKLDYWRMLELIDKQPTEKDKAALGVQVFRLKQKISEASGEEIVIKSIFNEGYQLVTAVRID
jgi:DNA-binding response OmpR family regulator